MADATCPDGVAHFWYFIKETETGFVWTGKFKDPMEVSFGGFGEPALYLIRLTRPMNTERKPRFWADWFKEACDTWAGQNTLVITEAREDKLEMLRETRADEAPLEPQQGDVIIQVADDLGLSITPLGRKVYTWPEVWQVLSEEFHDTQKYPNVWMYGDGEMHIVEPGFGTYGKGG